MGRAPCEVMSARSGRLRAPGERNGDDVEEVEPHDKREHGHCDGQAAANLMREWLRQRSVKTCLGPLQRAVRQCVGLESSDRQVAPARTPSLRAKPPRRAARAWWRGRTRRRSRRRQCS